MPWRIYESKQRECGGGRSHQFRNHVVSGVLPTYSPAKRIVETMQRGLRWMGSVVSMEKVVLTIHLAHDEEADVWYVAESDIPGLFLEAPTPQELISRLKDAAPEMVQLNQAEILAKQHDKKRKTPPQVSLRPVFDSPVDLAFA